METRPDPPIERVDTGAFAVRAVAERHRELLAEQGPAGTRLGIEAETSNGEHHPVWRDVELCLLTLPSGSGVVECCAGGQRSA